MNRIYAKPLGTLIGLALGVLVLCVIVPFIVAAPPPAKAKTPKTEHTVTAVDVSDLGEGQSLIVTKNGGVISVHPLLLLTSDDPQPPPPPPPPPPPGPVNTRAKLFQEAASKVVGDSSRDTNAKTLAAIYRTVALNAPANMKPADLKSLTKKSTEGFMPESVLPNWQPVRDLLGTQWTILDAKPTSVLPDYIELLKDAATGLEASAPNKAIDPVTLQKILDLVLLIIKIFFSAVVFLPLL